jgi:hypothetical protein
MPSQSLLLVTLAESQTKIEARRWSYWSLIGVWAARFNNDR